LPKGQMLFVATLRPRMKTRKQRRSLPALGTQFRNHRLVLHSSEEEGKKEVEAFRVGEVGHGSGSDAADEGDAGGDGGFVDRDLVI